MRAKSKEKNIIAESIHVCMNPIRMQRDINISIACTNTERSVHPHNVNQAIALPI